MPKVRSQLCDHPRECDQVYLGRCPGCPFVVEGDIPWNPGPKPPEDVVMTIEAFLQKAAFWHWHAQHGLYQWPMDAMDEFEPWLLPDDDATQDAYDAWHDALKGPYAHIYIEYKGYLLSLTNGPKNAHYSVATCRSPEGKTLGTWYVGTRDPVDMLSELEHVPR